jgi:hypothetical protein
MIIFYCRGCGTAIRRTDFEYGNVRIVEDAAFCIACGRKSEPHVMPTPIKRKRRRLLRSPR